MTEMTPVAVDPVKRIQDSRDARRFAEANAILNAILNKQVDDRALFTAAAPLSAACRSFLDSLLELRLLAPPCAVRFLEERADQGQAI